MMINEFLRFFVAGVLAVVAIANFAISMRSFESQSQLTGFETAQYYAMAVGFSVVIATNETPLTSVVIIALTFVPKIQATPSLLWLAYRIVISDRPVINTSYSNLSDASISSDNMKLSPIQATCDPTLLTTLKTAQAPTWV